jgi:hypothetical protein
MQPVCVCYLPICLSCNMRLHFIKVEESMCQVSGATQFIRQVTTASHKKCSEHAYIHIFSVDRQLFKLSREISQISAAREMNLIFSAINQKQQRQEIFEAHLYLTCMAPMHFTGRYLYGAERDSQIHCHDAYKVIILFTVIARD